MNKSNLVKQICLALKERRELQLDVEATALSQEKDEASKHRLKQVKEELSKIREELKPLKLRHQAGSCELV